MIEIVPTILTSDPEDFKNKIEQVQNFAQSIQIDICDGKFVETKTISTDDLVGIENNLPLEFHLMIEEPEKYLLPLAEIGAQRIIFHHEATHNPRRVIERIKTLDMEVGIALSPNTSISVLKEVDFLVDEILLLGVEPGFQGQEFIENTINRICDVRDLYPDILIGVDGGINETNIDVVAKAGADIVYVGNTIFSSDDPQGAYKKLLEISHGI